MKNKSKIILIVGPTASGKTKISIEVAKHFNAEIINADSRYLYKEPVIATAKVTEEEMQGIKHHMIDVISLNEDYSIFDYQNSAREILDKLISENKNIVITGGSGLYIKALLYDYKLDKTNNINKDYSNLTNEELKSMIDKINPNNDIHINNRQRMERYLNYYYQTGNLIRKTDEVDNKLYDFITFYLIPERDKLYSIIDSRVDIMFDNGLLEEANALKDFKHFKDVIGYKELISYYNNEISLDEAKNNIKKDTRHYAKRQITWFNNQMNNINNINIDYINYDEVIKNIISITNDYYK